MSAQAPAAAPRAGLSSGSRLLGRALLGVVLVLIAIAPLVFSDFFVSVILTKALWLGIAAASLIFLAAYGGMVSLGQVGLYGIAGFTMANLVQADGGLKAAWDPWIAIIVAILVTTAIGFAFGAIASRSEGIYFLVITLALSVIGFYFWGQVTQLSGFGGVNNVTTPAIVKNPVTQPTNLYYIALVVSFLVYLLIRYLVRTPFGIALQGLRDDPTRMRALGYNVALHRTVAFAVGAFIASFAGILSVWYNTRISPGSVGIGQTIDVLVIAVIGGLGRLEGAWIGAFAFALIDNYTREWTPDIGSVLGPDRFNTFIGIIFLLIVLISPGGLVGIGQQVRARLDRGQQGSETVLDSSPAPAAAPGSAEAAEKPGVR